MPSAPDFTLLIPHATEWLGVLAVAMFLARVPQLTAGRIGFLYPRRDGISALVVAAAAIIFAVALTTPQLQDFAQNVLALPAPANTLSAQLTTALMALLVVLAALIIRGQPGKSTGWSRDRLRIGLQSGIALALLTILLRNRASDLLRGIPQEVLFGLLPAALIALAEETVFRGYIQLRLSWWMGENRGWLVTTLLYVLFRAPLIILQAGPAGMLLPLLIVLGQGLIAGYLMQKSGHVLAPALYRAISIWMGFFP